MLKVYFSCQRINLFSIPLGAGAMAPRTEVVMETKKIHYHLPRLLNTSSGAVLLSTSNYKNQLRESQISIKTSPSIRVFMLLRQAYMEFQLY